VIVEQGELDRLDLVLGPVGVIGQGAGLPVVEDVVVLVVGLARISFEVG
jgi:hypothetical protein